MININLIRSIQIDGYSSTPKYIQLAEEIVKAINNKISQVGDQLPSINELSSQLRIARETVEKGYNFLKKQHVISSTPGKGYYITKGDIDRLRVAVFLNKLSAHKKIVYDALTEELGEEVNLDLFVYNSNANHLRRMLDDLPLSYDRYVVFPHFKNGRDQAGAILSTIPSEKIVLLGRTVPGLVGDCSVVYEDYAADIYGALKQMITPLSKYGAIKLIFPNSSDYPKAIIKGFCRFCDDYDFEHSLIDNLHQEDVAELTCYINLAEDDLITLLDKVIIKKYQVGKDVGIISYNETPLKKFILNGITTISADFQHMGRCAAKSILENTQDHCQVPFHVNLRSSI